MPILKVKKFLATTSVIAAALAGPMAAGAAAQDVCELDPETGECVGEPIDDRSFFPDDFLSPGADHFADDFFDLHNPNSDEIAFPGDDTPIVADMPECGEGGQLLVPGGGVAYVMPGDNVAVTNPDNMVCAS